MKQIVAGMATIALSAGIAQAQQCVQFSDGAARLVSEYGESIIGRGLTPNGAAVVIFANPDTGTWTVVVATPDGCSQVPAAGEAWVTFEPSPAGTDG